MESNLLFLCSEFLQFSYLHPLSLEIKRQSAKSFYDFESEVWLRADLREVTSIPLQNKMISSV